MARYQLGDQFVVETTFTLENGTPSSPTGLEAWVRTPSGTRSALTPVDQGSGVVRTTLPVFDESGVWRWRVRGTAGLIAGDQGTIKVDPDVTL